MAPRFYIDAPLRAGSVCTLSEDAAHHAIHVLRLRAGEEITVFNGRGGEFAARIVSIQRLKIRVDLLGHREIERESPLRVTLVQGVSAGDKMDSTLRKAVELGVAEVQPVLAARSVARPKGERAEGRRAHWQKVVIAACEQCGRNRIPEVHALIALSNYRPSGTAMRVLLSPFAQQPLSELSLQGSDFVVAAGPEAGFTSEEEAALVSSGFVPALLGPRVLRTETAAVAALAALSALRGDS
ncbi:MAG TPA: 16S rRNA (uracil(1498)-N(3))-methyltransferase [Burkholderiales bacterium]|nr:16S rRNA (uracil(1498)-N(3))-methyltransferase [Burkholderiales bacterium]